MKTSGCAKIYLRFRRIIKGKDVSFRWERLSKNRFEEFLDFKMEYYVPHEQLHVMSGIHKSKEAMAEYRQVMANTLKHPSYHIAVCCVEDTNVMVAFDSMVLIKSGEETNNVQVHTPELQKYFTISRVLENLCPVSEVMKKYGVQEMFDDVGLAVHPDYVGYGFSSEVTELRYIVCKEYNVPLAGAWITSPVAQHTANKHGWETIYETSSDALENILNTKLSKRQHYVYNLIKIV